MRIPKSKKELDLLKELSSKIDAVHKKRNPFSKDQKQQDYLDGQIAKLYHQYQGVKYYRIFPEISNKQKLIAMKKIYDTVHAPDEREVKEWYSLRVVNMWSEKKPIAHCCSTSVGVQLFHNKAVGDSGTRCHAIDSLENWQKKELIKMGYKLVDSEKTKQALDLGCSTTKKDNSELLKAADPLIKYMNEHCHPHMKIIVTTTSVEVLEGVISLPNIFHHLKD